MAQFDNVTYDYYSSTLGRSIVPDEATFNLYKPAEVLFVKSLINDDLIAEREDGGIDDACCMMIEEAYNAAQLEAGAGNVDTSETIGGYSHGMSAKAAEIAIEQNAKSAAEKKYKWLKLYCDITSGVL